MLALSFQKSKATPLLPAIIRLNNTQVSMVQHAHRSHFRLLCPESGRTEGAKGGIALYTHCCTKQKSYVTCKISDFKKNMKIYKVDKSWHIGAIST